MVTLPQTLERVKSDLAQLLTPQSIRQVCDEHQHRWRERVLDPVTTIHLFIQQVLHGNTACQHLRHLGGGAITAPAYCQARQRLPLAVLQAIVKRVGKLLDQAAAEGDLFCSHRTWLVDGSSFSMPDTPALQACFGQPGKQRPGCGFPVAHLLALFSAQTGALHEALALPLRTHDMSYVQQLHPSLRAGDVLVADRALCSFAHLGLILRGSMHAVFRMHQLQIVDFTCRRPHTVQGKHRQAGLPTSRWIRRLGRHDQIVEWVKPQNGPKWMTAAEFDALPETIRVRELRYRIRMPGVRTREVTLVTTLLNPRRYPARKLAQLYAARWEIELNLRHIKITMGLDVLKCKTVPGVLKELSVFVLVYNLVRTVMLEAARRQKVKPNRISFIDAQRWLCSATPGSELRALVINPLRPHRVEPRCIKRRMKEYDLMTKPRTELRERLLGKGNTS
jgi:DDE family transposase